MSRVINCSQVIIFANLIAFCLATWSSNTQKSCW